ncbi:hypothetical protein P4V33_09355 [Brevibacillus borstelensis]|uniref:hypothetical protein n=1 Tax=Brevibacillus borstelensis TaxID=45462 RepID=UPI002E240C3C|nr:hypothetical protein [Brevibacillus borstelensis]
MKRVLIDEFLYQHVGDIMASPSAFRRLYEGEKAEGNNVTLYPGMVLMQLEDGEVHYVWKNEHIYAQVYAYQEANAHGQN